eukprot:1422293-Rhodomonas_salina.2
MEKLLTQLTVNFGDLKSFTKYLIACVGAEAVQHKVAQSGPDCKVMQEGAKLLIGMRHDNILLSIDVVERALRVAESHRQHIKEAKAFKAGIERGESETEKDAKMAEYHSWFSGASRS